ncbi:MAG: protoheme IX farnesyltransferase [Nitrospiraceae bacterium]|nr:protoheme IX farnesyltransferase [Nitrospiraceae bacterium]
MRGETAMRRMTRVGPYWELCKPKISALSALSAAVGFVLSRGGIGTETAAVAMGVFFLACGASAMNHYQERGTDALMRRTRNRPLPSGRISPKRAVSFSLSLVIPGLLILRMSGGSAAPMLLGLLALLWYNGAYTLLKRKTAFAALPGAIVGALPPAIGWVAAGGTPGDPRLAFLCFFFFMWQTPHFWLLLLERGPEYEAAGLPSLTGIVGMSQLVRIIFVWTVAAAASVLLVAMEGITKSPVVNAALCTSAVWLIWSAAGLLRNGRQEYAPAFRRINVFALIVMALMSIDGLVRNVTL